MLSKTLCPPHVRFFDFAKQIDNVVGLLEVVLNVVVLGGNTKLYEFILESPALLEETMYFTLDFHFTFLLLSIVTNCVYIRCSLPGL